MHFELQKDKPYLQKNLGFLSSFILFLAKDMQMSEGDEIFHSKESESCEVSNIKKFLEKKLNNPQTQIQYFTVKLSARYREGRNHRSVSLILFTCLILVRYLPPRLISKT